MFHENGAEPGVQRCGARPAVNPTPLAFPGGYWYFETTWIDLGPVWAWLIATTTKKVLKVDRFKRACDPVAFSPGFFVSWAGCTLVGR